MTKSNQEELAPCPFCGGETTSIIIISPMTLEIPRKQSRICLTCDARGPETYSEKDVNKAWNTRPSPAKPVAWPEKLYNSNDSPIELNILESYAYLSGANAMHDKFMAKIKEIEGK